MYRLRELLDRYRTSTVVQVGFTFYRTNFPRDFFKMRELCERAGISCSIRSSPPHAAEKGAESVDGRIAEADRDLR